MLRLFYLLPLASFLLLIQGEHVVQAKSLTKPQLALNEIASPEEGQTPDQPNPRKKFIAFSAGWAKLLEADNDFIKGATSTLGFSACDASPNLTTEILLELLKKGGVF